MKLGSALSKLLLSAALVAVSAPFAQAHIVDLSEVEKLGNQAAAQWENDAPTGAGVNALLGENVTPAQTKQILDGINRRAVLDLRKFAVSLEGKDFDTFDEMKKIVYAHERVVRFEVLSNPRGYAMGRPMSYVVTEAEAARLSRTLIATWIEREPVFREKVDELVMMNDLQAEDVPSVRAYARSLTIAHAKDILAGMKGNAFFCSQDAEQYLESSFDEEIGHLRGEKLMDPAARASFIEDARSRFPAGISPLSGAGASLDGTGTSESRVADAAHGSRSAGRAH
jgi:hypothetical protein